MDRQLLRKTQRLMQPVVELVGYLEHAVRTEASTIVLSGLPL